MPTLPVRPRSLTIDSFDRRLSETADSCDLSALTFIDAYGLVGTACALSVAGREGHHPVVAVPDQEQVRKHLSRMGLADTVRALGLAVQLPARDAPERRDVVVPLARVEDYLAADRVGSLLWEQLRQHADPQVLHATVEGLWELVANALEHSGAEAMIMGQVYRYGEPPHHYNRVQIAIGDGGKGIRRSFLESEQHRPENDRAAIELALEYLATSVDDPGRGQGLSTTMEQVTELQGELVVRSGAAKIAIAPNEQRAERVPSLPGTIVCMSLPLYPWQAT